MRDIYENALVAWRSGWRSHGARLILVLGLALVATAFLAGAFSLRQPMIVTMDIGFSGMRILAVLLGLFWVQEMLAKDIERRTILFSLAYPSSRASYLVGRFLGVSALTLVALIGFGVLLLGVASASSWGYAETSRPDLGFAYWLTLSGIYFDVLLVVAFSIWLSSISETPFLPLILGLAFAIAGHALGPVIEYLAFSPDADKAEAQRFLPWLEVFRWLVPDLSRLDWRAAALYGQPIRLDTILYSLTMVFGYSCLALTFAYARFSRREFK